MVLGREFIRPEKLVTHCHRRVGHPVISFTHSSGYLFFTGDLGSGKSTALKHIARGWAEGNVEELKAYDHMFHVDLNSVQKDETIEDMIIQQHKELNDNNVQAGDIKAILEGKNEQKVLLLFDGDNTYRSLKEDRQVTGSQLETNESFRKVIEKKSLQNCWMIVTCTDGDHFSELKYWVDGVAELKGFNDQDRRYYVEKYLGKNACTQA